jgi:hypothetical protein
MNVSKRAISKLHVPPIFAAPAACSSPRAAISRTLRAETPSRAATSATLQRLFFNLQPPLVGTAQQATSSGKQTRFRLTQTFIFGEAEIPQRARLARGLAFTTKRKLEGVSEVDASGALSLFARLRFSKKSNTKQMDGMDPIRFWVKYHESLPSLVGHFNGSIGRLSPPSCKRTQFR